MENSSKALLIAASVLIVIILISLGIKILNSTSGTTDQVDSVMQTTNVTAFNSKFSAYMGNSVSASKTRTFISLVQSHNAADSRKVNLCYAIKGSYDTTLIHKIDSSNLQKIYNKISDNYRYKISVTTNCILSNDTSNNKYGYLNGYICCVTINQL